VALLLFYDAGSWLGNVFYRLCFIHQVFLLTVSLLWPLVVVKVALSPALSWIDWGLLHGAIFVTGAASASVRNLFFAHRVAWYIPLLSPLLSALNCLFYVWAFAETLFWYVPAFKRPNSRKSREG
jgi:hypothetical protein